MYNSHIVLQKISPLSFFNPCCCGFVVEFMILSLLYIYDMRDDVMAILNLLIEIVFLIDAVYVIK